MSCTPFRINFPFTILSVLFTCSLSPAQTIQFAPSSTPLRDVWIPDGLVSCVHESNGELFIGGTFKFVGPLSGSFVAIDPTNPVSPASWPVFDGEVYDVIADGSGGWFVAGTFQQASDQKRAGLARIHADGSIDPWAPLVKGPVRCMALAGGTLFVGGTFTEIDGVVRRALAAFDVQSGSLLPWNPAPNSSFQSYEYVGVLLVNGNEVYAGGYFDDVIGTIARKNFVALDAATGAVFLFNPNPNDTVSDLAMVGSHLLLAGNFSVIAGQPRSRLAIVDPASGALDPLSVPFNSSVFSVEVWGNVLYAGGLFTSVNGIARSCLAAIDLTTGAVLPFDPSIAGSDEDSTAVKDLCLSGSTLYVAGSFTSVGQQERHHVAAVDAVTAVPSSFGPALAGPGTTYASALWAQNGLIGVGGAFKILGAEKRLGVAAYDLQTLSLRPWAPQFKEKLTDTQGGQVFDLAFAGQVVYACGTFNYVNGASRAKLAAVDRTTGSLNPAFDAGLSVNDIVRTVEYGNNRLYYPNACLDAATGALLWSFYTNSTVKTLRLSGDGQTLLLGGSFQQVATPVTGYISRNRAAAIDVNTLSVTPWDPNLDKSVEVIELSESAAYIGGDFLQVNGSAQAGGAYRPGLAEVDLLTGKVTGWNPLITQGSLGDICVSREYLFLARTGLPSGLSAVDRTLGLPLDWEPLPGWAGKLTLIDGRLLLGSGNIKFATLPSYGLAALDAFTMREDVDGISLSSGGCQNLAIDVGVWAAGKAYWTLGSFSGAVPGTQVLGNLVVPLNYDGYFHATIFIAMAAPLVGGFGYLDQNGRAQGAVVLPPGTNPAFVGFTLRHAAVVFDAGTLQPLHVTNPVRVDLLP